MTPQEIDGIRAMISGTNEIMESCKDREKQIFFEGIRTGFEIWLQITVNASKKIALNDMLMQSEGNA